MYKKKQANNNSKGGTSTSKSTSTSHMDIKNQHMDLRTIMKDIELFGSSHMTWKERKEMENRKVVSLGGKTPKNQRLPLSVARVMMKKQKEREQKMLEENFILGRFGGKLGGGAKRSVQKRKPEDMVLKSSEGNFRNGVLDVKHLLRSGPSRDSAPFRDSDIGNHMFNLGKNKGSGKKNGGKKKSGGRKRH